MSEAGELTRAGVVLDARYVFLRKLGKGGAAEVWLADDLSDSTPAAVKILHSHLRLQEEPRRRFAHEAEMLRELAHRSIVRAKSFVLDGPRPYIAMEYREGVPLDQELRSRREDRRYFEDAVLVSIVRDVADAIEHAHAHGVVHRDLKPANIMLLASGASACVLDFGLARLIGDSDGTTVGRVVGTYRYMSPEQARGERVDHKSDIFSLGLIVFQLLTLERPWGEDTSPRQMFEAIAYGPRPRPSGSRAALDPRLDAIVARATAIDPSARHASALELARDVASVLTPRPPAPPPPRKRSLAFPIAIVAAAVAVTVVAFELAPGSSGAGSDDDPVVIAPIDLPRVTAKTSTIDSAEPEPEPAPEPETATADPRPAIKARRRIPPAPPAKTVIAAPSDRFLAARRAIALAQSAPEDPNRFRAAGKEVRALIGAGEDAGLKDRWRRMLEIAELSYDHPALLKIVDEVEARSK